jgi:hypothetical protein
VWKGLPAVSNLRPVVLAALAAALLLVSSAATAPAALRQVTPAAGRPQWPQNRVPTGLAPAQPSQTQVASSPVATAKGRL